MRLLLDTQILIFLIASREALSRPERTVLSAADELLASAVSLFELRIKQRAERRRGFAPSVPSPKEAIAFCKARRIAIHPLLPEDTSAELVQDTAHGDPFDEMLIAHASTLQARLLTRDQKLWHHPLAYHP